MECERNLYNSPLELEIPEIEGATFLKSGGRDRKLDTGFMVLKRLNDKVMAFNPISDRICPIPVKGEKRNICNLNTHVPTKEKQEDWKTYFMRPCGT